MSENPIIHGKLDASTGPLATSLNYAISPIAVQPVNSLAFLDPTGKVAILVEWHPTPRVTIPEGITWDDAAQEFWRVVNQWAPK